MAKLICTIELDKEKGLTLKVEDPDGKVSQTLTLDGTALTLEVKSDSDTSTVVQKADSITLTCKALTVDAENITLQSKKGSVWKSQETLQVESAKDMSFTSSEKLTQKATGDASLTSEGKVAVKATEALALEGKQVQVEAKSGPLTLKSPKLELSGKETQMEGATLKVSTSGDFEVSSKGVATLEGSTVNISGNSINLG
ncbi:hypothetical protein A176_002396 [Myxococcus hansupus]|uniref:Uncharacterized protein n=1 Tax=Pseudomyxococcus hansupus TaxID=1297742 RepID=A0A0H4WRS0_9BACT|nr:hypothetical protein [Myxococcus hansupus]AKQ65484.1 hypothetical protein A176_002396 [Myxococcus hansupus]